MAHVVGTVGAIFMLTPEETRYEGLQVHASKTGPTAAYSRAPRFHLEIRSLLLPFSHSFCVEEMPRASLQCWSSGH